MSSPFMSTCSGGPIGSPPTIVYRYIELLHERMTEKLSGVRCRFYRGYKELHVSGCTSVLMEEEIEELVRFTQDSLHEDSNLWLEGNDG